MCKYNFEIIQFYIYMQRMQKLLIKLNMCFKQRKQKQNYYMFPGHRD